MCVSRCRHVYVYMYMYVCMYVCIYVCIYVCMYICMCISRYRHVYVCIKWLNNNLLLTLKSESSLFL